MRYSSRQALEQVIERATRLASSPLSKDPVDVVLRWSPPDPPQVSGADAISFQAAVRLARQFLQANEAVSFEALGTKLADDSDLSPGFQRDLAKLRRKLESALDQAPAMRAKVKGHGAPKHGDVLEAFLYGDLERLGQAPRESLKVWLAQPASALLIRAQLQTALSSVFKATQELRRICERELLDAAR